MTTSIDTQTAQLSAHLRRGGNATIATSGQQGNRRIATVSPMAMYLLA
jgi:hypothetical protein